MPTHQAAISLQPATRKPPMGFHCEPISPRRAIRAGPPEGDETRPQTTGCERRTGDGVAGVAGDVEWPNCLAASPNRSRQTAGRPGSHRRVRRGFAAWIGLPAETGRGIASGNVTS